MVRVRSLATARRQGFQATRDVLVAMDSGEACGKRDHAAGVPRDENPFAKAATWSLRRGGDIGRVAHHAWFKGWDAAEQARLGSAGDGQASLEGEPPTPATQQDA
jgi:hypothetical protein